MNSKTLPDSLSKQLGELDPGRLNLLIVVVRLVLFLLSLEKKLANFLQYKKVVQPDAEVETDLESMALAEFWENWFEEVEALEVSLTEPSSEYEEGLLAKYRQQGLEL